MTRVTIAGCNRLQSADAIRRPFSRPKRTRNPAALDHETVLQAENAIARKDTLNSSEKDGIYPPNASGFNLQMAKQRRMANVTHAR
jgi:hypothetical protein